MRKIRPYQLDALRAIDRALVRDGRVNTVLSLPPSGGKTFVATRWLKKRPLAEGGRVLWLAHRDELLEQARDDIAAYCPDATLGRWDRSRKDLKQQITVASIGAFKSLVYACQVREVEFDTLVYDEAHHGAGEAFETVLNKIKHKRRLGLTGTPRRRDRRYFGFDHICFQMKFMQLVELGWCAQPIYLRFKTKQAPKLEENMSDFTATSMKCLNNTPRNRMVLDHLFEHPERWPAMVYCVGVDHAKAMGRAIERRAKKLGRECRVHVVLATTAKEERRDIIHAYKEGAVDILVNVGCFTEGTDLPTIRSIHLARPTMSEVLYLQMALRGGRSKPGYQAPGDDPTIGRDPRNCFWIYDYVDSVQHYISASNAYALENFFVPGIPNPNPNPDEKMERDLKIEGRELFIEDVDLKKFRYQLIQDEGATLFDTPEWSMEDWS